MPAFLLCTMDSTSIKTDDFPLSQDSTKTLMAGMYERLQQAAILIGQNREELSRAFPTGSGHFLQLRALLDQSLEDAFLNVIVSLDRIRSAAECRDEEALLNILGAMYSSAGSLPSAKSNEAR